MKIGDKFWIFDWNFRVYEKDGVKSSVPIYSEHFRSVKVVGETSRSWLIGYSIHSARKVPKKGSLLEHGIYTDETKEQKIWMHDHRYNVARMCERANYEQIRAIADILNYKPREVNE